MDATPFASLKRCTKCGHQFPATLEFFYSSKGTKSSQDGLYARCKTCVSTARRKRLKVPDGYKYCPGCKQKLPQTTDYFYAVNGRPDGLAPFCKTCQHERQIANYARAKKREPGVAPAHMRCSRCGIPKPATLEFFTMNPLCRYGLNTICKECTNRALRHHRETNPARKAYEAHYNATHKEQTASRLKRWYEDGGKEIVANNTRNRRARLRNAEGKHSAKDIRAQYVRQKGQCYYCHTSLPGKYHVDHIVPITRGGSNDPSNLVITCHSCNESKNDRLPHEWPEGGRLL